MGKASFRPYYTFDVRDWQARAAAAHLAPQSKCSAAICIAIRNEDLDMTPTDTILDKNLDDQLLRLTMISGNRNLFPVLSPT